MRVFFYGTLLDPDVRRIVLPHLACDLTLRPAELRGFRRVAACDGDYPVLSPHPSSRVRGYLADGLDLIGLARAAHFEGARYQPALRSVSESENRKTDAWLFLPVDPRRHASRKPWDLGLWQRRRKRHLLLVAKQWMAEFGAKDLASGDLSWQGRRTLRSLAKKAPRKQIHIGIPRAEAAK
ncbi:gamma-glutamylcyclotransferase family protein [Algihabitans albus]|uniref:gamma-glutamylcyclotransferase family protein n=1 Tax=Algihabitans albus TaxID=2164067 RepID=UPI000E5D9FE2|nr:gamma-glutamylcyclotransferase family protein [Algihabitans albus]